MLARMSETTTTADEVVARADALRPRLVEEQAATEARTRYSEEVHEIFTDAGFYRLLVPRRFGGLETDVETFYRVMVSVSRGCPSTGWMLTLGSGHALQIGSYWSEQAQAEIFGDGHFVSPASFALEDALAKPGVCPSRIRPTFVIVRSHCSPMCVRSTVSASIAFAIGLPLRAPLVPPVRNSRSTASPASLMHCCSSRISRRVSSPASSAGRPDSSARSACAT